MSMRLVPSLNQRTGGTRSTVDARGLHLCTAAAVGTQVRPCQRVAREPDYCMSIARPTGNASSSVNDRESVSRAGSCLQHPMLRHCRLGRSAALQQPVRTADCLRLWHCAAGNRTVPRHAPSRALCDVPPTLVRRRPPTPVRAVAECEIAIARMLQRSFGPAHRTCMSQLSARGPSGRPQCGSAGP